MYLARVKLPMGRGKSSFFVMGNDDFPSRGNEKKIRSLGKVRIFSAAFMYFVGRIAKLFHDDRYSQQRLNEMTKLDLSQYIVSFNEAK